MDKLSDFLGSTKLGQYLAIALIIFVAFVALNSLWDVLAKWGWVSPAIETHSITLSAEGKVTVTPDTAKLQVSVVTEGKTADEVQPKNTEAMNKVIGFVKNQGVEDKDIKTTNYNLYPRYDYIEGKQVAAGYTLTQTVQVKVRDLAKVGEIITGSVSRGANQVYGVEFLVDDPDSFKAEARAEAFEKTNAKAKELAKLANVRLGKVITFSESFSGVPPPIFYERAFGVGGGAPAPDTQAGSQEIVVNITVSYEIR